MRANTEADFWPQVDMRTAEECWLWKGAVKDKGRATNRRYGIFTINRRTKMAHRYAYQQTKRCSVMPGFVLMHTCDTPLCCNPNHMRIGTIAENNKDRDDKKRHVPLRGEKHGNSKFTDDQRLQFVCAYEMALRMGLPGRVVADWYKVPLGSIVNMVSSARRRQKEAA